MISIAGLYKQHFVYVNVNKGLVEDVKCRCLKCQKEEVLLLDVTWPTFISWWQGKLLIQNAFKYLSRDEAEIMVSGICSECFDTMFSGEE